MNTIFSFNRFLSLCKREFIEGRSQWLRWWGIWAAILFAALFLRLGEVQHSIFYIVTAAASALFIQGISNRQKRVFYLMIPASPLEKMGARYVYISSLIFIAFPLALLSAKVGQQVISHFIFQYPFDWTWSDYFPQGKNYFQLVVGFFTFQVIYMFGSMVWLKNSFIKTTLFHTLYCALLIVSLTFIFYQYIKGREFQGMNLDLREEQNRWIEYLIYGIHLGMVSLFYVLCYFRFRELQIVQKQLPLFPTVKIVLACYAFLLIVIISTVLLQVNVHLQHISLFSSDTY